MDNACLVLEAFSFVLTHLHYIAQLFNQVVYLVEELSQLAQLMDGIETWIFILWGQFYPSMIASRQSPSFV